MGHLKRASAVVSIRHAHLVVNFFIALAILHDRGAHGSYYTGGGELPHRKIPPTLGTHRQENNQNHNRGSNANIIHRHGHNNYPNPYNHTGVWLPATATWYGSANGAGSDGGACGYGSVANTAYGSNVGAGSPVLFRNGKGCGACYQVKCLMGGGVCSDKGVIMVITDECPGGYCAFGRTHFDLSGSAFGRMASGTGTVSSILNAGVVQVLYRRVPCYYQATRLAFQVNEGATSYWFSMLVRYEDGDDDLDRVELMQAGSSEWQQMQQLWGAYWCLNEGPLQAPFSVRLTSSSGMSVTAQNAIPLNWAPGAVYNAHVNFLPY